MTPSESRELLDRLFVFYPHLVAYIAGTDQSQKTIDAWRAAIARLHIDDAAEAIERLMDGRAEIPLKPWEISNLPGIIRNVAGRVADERAKVNRVKAIDDARQAHRPSMTSAAARSFGECHRIGRAAGACCSRNEISRERNQEIVEYLKRCNEANATPEVPADVRHEYDNPREITWDRSRKPLPFKIRNYS